MTKTLSNILYGVIALSFIVGFLYYFVDSAAQESGYNIVRSEKYELDHSYTANITEKFTEVQSSLQNASVYKLAYLALVPDVLSIVKDALLLPINILIQTTNSIEMAFGLPEVFSTFTTAFIILSVIIAFIALVMRWEL